MSENGRSPSPLDAATDAVLAQYALFGNLHGRAVELTRDTVREIVGVALAAVTTPARE